MRGVVLTQSERKLFYQPSVSALLLEKNCRSSARVRAIPLVQDGASIGRWPRVAWEPERSLSLCKEVCQWPRGLLSTWLPRLEEQPLHHPAATTERTAKWDSPVSRTAT